MRPHPRARKVGKWVGTVLSLALIALLVLSLNLSAVCAPFGGHFVVYLSAGTLGFSADSNEPLLPSSQFSIYAVSTGPPFDSNGSNRFHVPIPIMWILFPGFIITVYLFATDAGLAHFSRVGRCRKCGYDLAGLAEGACPECGRATGGRK